MYHPFDNIIVSTKEYVQSCIQARLSASSKHVRFQQTSDLLNTHTVKLSQTPTEYCTILMYMHTYVCIVMYTAL